MNAKPKTRVYKCDFGSCACTVELPEEPPKKGTNPVEKVLWQGKAHPDLMKRYVKWMNSVLSECATRWNMRVFYAYTQDRNSFLAYVFDPHREPKLVQKQ